MKVNLPKAIQVKILERFMDEKELNDFAEEYMMHRLINKAFSPTNADWKFYRTPGLSLQDWKKHWKDVKTNTTIIARIGKMALLENYNKK